MRLPSHALSDTTTKPGRLTRDEIYQQPDLWPTTLQRIRANKWVSGARARPVVVTGAGTSAYAATAVAEAWPNAQAIPTTDLLCATTEELARYAPGFCAGGLLVSLGRSGDSPESVEVVKRMQRLCGSVEHLAITCNAEGRLANTPGVSGIVLDPRTNDQSLAMTSSFSNLVLAGLCLEHAPELEISLEQICAGVRDRLPAMEREAERIAQEYAPARVVLLAGNPMRALREEGALKILELTAGGTVTLAESFLGLRHGPMSFLRPETLVLCWLSVHSDRRRYEKDLLAELKYKGLGRIVAIAPEPEPDIFHEWIPAQSFYENEALRVPFEIPFAQLLAYHLSLAAGLDPDNPSPMGAITRVVPKFRIYEDAAN